MTQNAASLLSAFVRAHHTRGRRERIFTDPLAYDLLGSAEYSRIGRSLPESMGVAWNGSAGNTAEIIGWMMDHRLGPIYLGRSAFAEHSLENAAMIGTSQYILFGAGLDSFAHRMPNWAGSLAVFEVDHPLASRDKRQRINEWGIQSPAALRYVTADLMGYMWPATLIACPGFDPKARSFCNLTGLSFQLSRLHLEGLLERLSHILPKGSSVVLDYANRNSFEPVPELYEIPYRFHCDDIERILETRGFLIYEHLEPEDLSLQYFDRYNAIYPARPMQPPHGVHFCLAVRR